MTAAEAMQMANMAGTNANSHLPEILSITSSLSKQPPEHHTLSIRANRNHWAFPEVASSQNGGMMLSEMRAPPAADSRFLISRRPSKLIAR